MKLFYAMVTGWVLVTAVDAQAAGNWISSSEVSVTQGDYGTGDDTTITQLSETIKYRGTTGELGVVVPYLFRRGGAVTPGESRRARNQTIPSNADGIGDVQLKGKYFWIQETDTQPSVDLAGRIKFPTASESDGLGTGRFDVGFGPELLKWFGSFFLLGDVELVLRDKPDNSTIKSTRVDYSVGGGYSWTDRLTTTLTLDGGTQTNSGTDAPLELVLSGVYKMTESVSATTFVLGGLTDGSPDFGAGVGITVRF